MSILPHYREWLAWQSGQGTLTSAGMPPVAAPTHYRFWRPAQRAFVSAGSKNTAEN
jgi:hypothetical protein